jgi:nucleoside-diphosphate-sugar epimerase
VYDADTWRPYCHVRDFAEVIRRTIEAPRDAVEYAVFNAGGDRNNATKRDIVEMIREVLPNARIRYQEHGADPRNYRVSFARIRHALHFEPRYSIRDGIAELVSALDRRLFDLVDRRPNFHHNIEIAYP